MSLKTSTLFLTSKRITTRFSVIMNSYSSDANDVLFQDVGNKGIITLNRPKALNALNLSMVNKIYPALEKWENEKLCVIVKGEGRAFCAGGDVKSVVQDGIKGGKLGQQFFRNEYTMNGLIGSYKIPYIAFIHGIVMGGGVGLSVHGKYRIATETSVFAMPETQIGLFPDVGGSYFLPRLKGKLGWYLALTGYRLKGAELVHAKIATHLCNSKYLPELESALLKCNTKEEIDDTLNKYNEKDLAPFSLKPQLDQIDKCFSGNTMEEIMKNLENDGSDWAKTTKETLSKMSPTSMKVTLKLLNMGSKMDLKKCLQNEFRVAVASLNRHDFFEGVRALLIDKDQNPKWKPTSLEQVSDELVNEHFNKLADDQELKHKL